MATLDIIAIVFIAIFTIIGVFRGLTKTLFKFFGFLLAVILAFYTCAPIGKLFANSFGEQAEYEAQEWLISIDQAYPGEELFTTQEDWTDPTNRNEAIRRMGVPSLFSSIIITIISDDLNDFGENAVLAEVLPPLLTQWGMTALAFLVLLLIYSICLLVARVSLKKLIDKVVVLKIIDKIGGGAVGAALGVLIYSVIFFVLAYVPIPFISDLRNTINEQVVLSEETSKIAAWLAQSPIITFLSGLFNFK